LNPLWVQDLVLKVLYFRGYLSGFKVAEEITLPFAGVTDQILVALKGEKLIEVKSSQGGLGRALTRMGLPEQASSAHVKLWIAANMPARPRSRSKCITRPFAARKADA